MAEWNRKANDLFVRAGEINTPDEWRRFLEQECGGDADLLAQVESLLVAGGRLGSFLEKPAVPALAALGATAAYPLITAGPNTVIGPYRLMEHLGEGGFGLVFVAEQQVPVRRKVALKIIKPGMDTRDSIARFEAERQALALMDHPNIARVLDAGTTGSGRPYFVMELVKGIPITRFCDEHHTTLFQPVTPARPLRPGPITRRQRCSHSFAARPRCAPRGRAATTSAPAWRSWRTVASSRWWSTAATTPTPWA
jgi:hypothetical protein